MNRPVIDFDEHTSDGMLVAATLAGEAGAFVALVGRYQAPLLRAAISRLGRREVAEEAVQEALLCAHRWLASYDSRFSFRTWLWTILLQQCSRQARREARQGLPAIQNTSAADGGQDVGVCPGASPLDVLLARESGQRVNELLSRLPEAQADALRLRFFGELTFPEIAAAMQCSEAGAKHRVKCGLLKLARWLRTSGGQPASRPMGDVP